MRKYFDETTIKEDFTEGQQKEIIRQLKNADKGLPVGIFVCVNSSRLRELFAEDLSVE